MENTNDQWESVENVMRKVIDQQEEAVSEPDIRVISVLQYQVSILTNLLKFITPKRAMDLVMNRFFLIV